MKNKFVILLAATATLLASCATPCPDCNGTGFVNRRGYNGGRIRSERCQRCDGSGLDKVNVMEIIRTGVDVARDVNDLSTHRRYR